MNIFMTLAMDLQTYIEKNKDEWYADGKIEGKVEASRNIALRFLHNGISSEQVALGTGLSLEEIHKLRNVQQRGCCQIF